jgi:hypothetical protein
MAVATFDQGKGTPSARPPNRKRVPGHRSQDDDTL